MPGHKISVSKPGIFFVFHKFFYSRYKVNFLRERKKYWFREPWKKYSTVKKEMTFRWLENFKKQYLLSCENEALHNSTSRKVTKEILSSFWLINCKKVQFYQLFSNSVLTTGWTKITLVLLKSKYFQGLFDYLQNNFAIKTVKGLQLKCI